LHFNGQTPKSIDQKLGETKKRKLRRRQAAAAADVTSASAAAAQSPGNNVRVGSSGMVEYSDILRGTI
jgi:hypothetical protein